MNILQRRLLALSLGLVAACGGGGGGDSGGDTTGGGTITIPAPSDLVFPTATSIYLTDVTITANIPTYHGTVDHFSIAPPLPAGMAIHPTLGAIYGTPSETEPRTIHTVTATNAGGSTHCPLTITVVAPPRYIYVLCDDGTISIFRDDPFKGQVRRVGFVAPDPADSGPEKLVIHPNQRFAYVTNLDSSNISVYTIAPGSGWLTAGDPVPIGLGQHSLAIDPTGKWAFVSSRIADEIQVYSISPTTGALTPEGLPVSPGTQPSALALDLSGKYLFVTLHGDPTTGDGSALAVFGVNAMTGALTPIGSPFALGSSMPVAVTVDPVKTQLYVLEESTHIVAVLHFDAATGAIQSIGVHPTGGLPTAVSAHPSGKFVYVTHGTQSVTEDSVMAFKVNATSGNIAPVDGTECGKVPTSIRTDPTGSFAYVVGHDSNDLRQYKVTALTGVLTAEDELVTRSGPIDVAIVQAPHLQMVVPRFAYNTNAGSNDVSAFTIQAGNGAISEIFPTVMSGTAPVSLALDPQQRYVYVANQLSSNVAIYSPSTATGTLFEVAPLAPVSGSPTHITVEPSGRFVYICCRGAVNPDAGLLLSYSINAGTGALTIFNVQFTDPRPTWVATDPTGRFLYIACFGLDDGTGANIRKYDLPLVSGIPQMGPSSDPTPSVSSLAFHPKGKYLYCTEKGTPNITRQFAIDPHSGGLSSVGTGVSNGVGPAGIELSPDGRFAYVAYTNISGIGHVAFFHVDPMTGELMTPPDLTLGGPHPSALALDPTGHFLYVTNVVSNTISAMTINSETGQLTLGMSTMTGLAPGSIVVMGVPQ